MSADPEPPSVGDKDVELELVAGAGASRDLGVAGAVRWKHLAEYFFLKNG